MHNPKVRRLRSEKLRVYDTLHDANGRLLASGESHEIIGEVEVLYKSKKTGNAVITRRSIHRNDLLVTGAVFLSEKVNNIRSSFLTTPIDLEQGVHTVEEIDTSSDTVPMEHIVGIMVGNGGCGDTYNTVHKVHRTDRNVPGVLPFRVVPWNADLEGADRNRYLLRVQRGDYVYYYGKKFTATREINVMYDDGTIVPTNVDVIGDANGKYIQTFTKYTAIVDESDIREYFKLTQGSTLRSLVNSVGLLTGYLGEASDSADKGGGVEEVFNARMMTTLNMESSELKDSASTITFIYRLYFT